MKAKPIIVIIVTLIIGFVLGMLTSAQIRYHKLKPVRVYFSEERFREGFYRTIQPDEKQKVKIDEILDKYARINSEMQSTFRKQLETSMKDFRKEIDSNLTKDQLARLREMDERRQQMMRDRKGRENDSSDFRGGFRRHNSEEGRSYREGTPPHFERDTTRLPGNK
jgi:hypothetical protein